MTFQVPRQILALAFSLAALVSLPAGCTRRARLCSKRPACRTRIPQGRQPVADDWIDSSDRAAGIGTGRLPSMVVRLSGPDARSPGRPRLPAEHFAARSRVSRGRSSGATGRGGGKSISADARNCLAISRKRNAVPRRPPFVVPAARSSPATSVCACSATGGWAPVWRGNWISGDGFAARWKRPMPDLDSSVEDYDDVLVLLIAEVATAYVDYRTVDQRLTFARGNADMQAGEQLASRQHAWPWWRSTARSTPRKPSPIWPERSRRSRHWRSRRQNENRLCVLLGLPPQDLGRSAGGNQAGARRSGECGGRRSGGTVAAQARRALRRTSGCRIERRYRCRPSQPLSAHCVQRFHGIRSGAVRRSVQCRCMVRNRRPSFRWNVLNYGRSATQRPRAGRPLPTAGRRVQQTVLRANEEVGKRHRGLSSLSRSINCSNRAWQKPKRPCALRKPNTVPAASTSIACSRSSNC